MVVVAARQYTRIGDMSVGLRTLFGGSNDGGMSVGLRTLFGRSYESSRDEQFLHVLQASVVRCLSDDQRMT